VLAGKLRLRGIIQELTDGVGVRGGLTKTWAEYKKRWFQAKGGTGTERFVDDREHAEGTGTYTCRHVPGLTPKMRLLLPREGTTLNGAINNSVTTITVTSADDFPPANPYRIRVGSELMDVTAGQATTSWTVTRGADGTTAASHGDGAAVRHMIVHDIVSVINVGERNRTAEVMAREIR